MNKFIIIHFLTTLDCSFQWELVTAKKKTALVILLLLLKKKKINGGMRVQVIHGVWNKGNEPDDGRGVAASSTHQRCHQ